MSKTSDFRAVSIALCENLNAKEISIAIQHTFKNVPHINNLLVEISNSLNIHFDIRQIYRISSLQLISYSLEYILKLPFEKSSCFR